MNVRELSCYCDGCRTGAACKNTEYVSEWKPTVLKKDENRPVSDKSRPKTNNTPPKMDSNPPVTEENPIETPENPAQHIDQPVNNAQCSSSSDNVTEHYEVNDFVAVSIETKRSKFCYFAKVVEIESDDLRVEYLEKRGQHYQYPELPEDSWQPNQEIVCKLPAPETVITASRVKCIFSLNDQQKKYLKSFQLK